MLADSEAILADIMAEVEGRAPAKSAAEVAARSVTMPSTSAAVPKNGAAAKKRATAATIATPVSDMVAAEIVPASKVSPAKPAKPAKVEPPGMPIQPAESRSRSIPAASVADEPFVPPADYMKPAAPELSPAQLKEMIRKEQLAKAAEAEERKKQQLERKAKKAQKVCLCTMRAASQNSVGTHSTMLHPISLCDWYTCCLQAKELAVARAEEEEQRKLADRARIEREAAVQRAAAQKKKEAQARKKAAADSKAAAKTAAKTKSAPAASRPKALKSSSTDAKKIKSQTQTYTVIGVIAAIITFIVVMALSSD